MLCDKKYLKSCPLYVGLENKTLYAKNPVDKLITVIYFKCRDLRAKKTCGIRQVSIKNKTFHLDMNYKRKRNVGT